MNANLTPYALFEGHAGGFLIVNLPEMQTALPYLGLRQMKHYPRPERIVLQFAELNVEVQGSGLTPLFEALAIMRVRRINTGASDRVRIDKIEVLEG